MSDFYYSKNALMHKKDYNALGKMKPTKTNANTSTSKNVNVAGSIANIGNKKVNEATQKAINSTLSKVKPAKVTTNAKSKTLDDKTKNKIKKAKTFIENLFTKEKVVGPKVPNNKRLWS